MQKIIFFIPLLIFAAFYGIVAIAEVGAVSPVVLVWLVLFLVSGILLSQNVAIGGAIGGFPALHMLYMSTQNTGQILPVEFPIGIIVLAFYAACSIFLLCQNKKKPKKSST